MGELEKEIRQAVSYATEHATNFFNAKTSEDFEKVDKKVFIAKCHEGFDLAQDLIVKRVLEFEKELKPILEKRKALSRSKKKKELASDSKYSEVLKEERAILNKILFFRRVADVLAWTILKMNKVLIRGTHTLNDHHGFLEDKNIESALDTIPKIKKPGEFYLINDITTCLGSGAGDMLKVGPGGFQFVELKTGKINRQVLEFVLKFKDHISRKWKEKEVDPEPWMLQDKEVKDFFNINSSLFGDKTLEKHIERMMRQMDRMHAVLDYDKKNIGKDISLTRTGKETGRRKQAFVVEAPDKHAFDHFNDSLDSLKSSPLGFTFLHYGEFMIYLFTDNEHSKIFDLKKNSAFVRSMNAKHMIHHAMKNDVDRCAYITWKGNPFEKEFAVYSKYLVFDWKQQIMHDWTLIPPFMLGLDLGHTYDLLFDRKSLFVYFDRKKFVDFLNIASDGKLEARATEEIDKEGAGIELRLLGDSKHMPVAQLGWGIIFRMLFEFQSPESIIEQMMEINTKGDSALPINQIQK
ncbi:MAG: hypothetical protein HY434_01075 [Candidatus Liptonbacteria bacterium]|nr:hypothetical protein [Candidatus Niyogibacteria bacterium]MBI4087406.1 hypothetical protein [Candidatus Liptonbacteria bacterium]